MTKAFLGTMAAVAACASLLGSPALADVVYTFDGTVTSLQYNNITPGSIPIPFSMGESVVAELTIPHFSHGIFSVTSTGQFYVNGNYEGQATDFGSVSFGQNSIAFNGGVGSTVQGFYAGGVGGIGEADFCCNFGAPFSAAVENGQALFNADFALYLPTGNTSVNVTANFSGRWSVQGEPVPEPASLALVGASLGAT